MVTVRTIPIILTLFLTAVFAAAQTQTPAAKPESSGPPVTGSITGRVVDETGQALPHAMVSIRAAGAARREQVVGTDREGVFRISGLEAVAYMLSVSMPSYIIAPRDPDSTPTAVRTYKIGDNATFTLVKGGVITGSVFNANGEPLVGVNVRVQMIRDTNGRLLRTGYRNEVTTDDRGIYRIYSLPSGTYVVTAGGSPLHSSGNFSAFETDASTYAPSS